MGSVSKHALNKVCYNNCCSISHPWSTCCGKGSLYMFISSFIGTGKFFLLIYLIQHIAKKKSLTVETIRSTVINYLRETCFGAVMSSGFVGAQCFFRLILRKYGYYTLALLPASIGGIAIFLVAPIRRGFSITTFQYLVLEITYKVLQEKGIFKKTVFFETGFFMICSAFLMYLLRSKENCNTFMWFFSPDEAKELNKSTNKICSHKGTCWQHVLGKNTFKHFLFGFVLQLARKILTLKTKNAANIIKLFFGLDTYLLGLFTGSYALIYKIAVCLLCHWLKRDSSVFALPAGFIAGSTYAIHPNLTIALIALTNLIKITLENSLENCILSNFPWQEVSFIISSGIIFHIRTMHPHICPKHATNLMSSMTNKRANEIYNAFKSLIDATK